MKASAYSASGTKAASDITLSKDIFDIETKNHELLKEAYDAYLANGRVNLAKTKTRGLISGGGKKPWRQKGTGRARVGSSRTPIWRGGGIIFGPTGHENYSKNMPLKAKRQALRQALTMAGVDKKILIIEDIKLKEAKTAELAKLLKKLKLEGLTLIIVDKPSKELLLSSNNIPSVMLTTAVSLNVYDVINTDHLVITKAALKLIEERLEVKK